jgi:hypothetical protein
MLRIQLHIYFLGKIHILWEMLKFLTSIFLGYSGNPPAEARKIFEEGDI